MAVVGAGVEAVLGAVLERVLELQFWLPSGFLLTSFWLPSDSLLATF
jgi:hypothetical protein